MGIFDIAHKVKMSTENLKEKGLKEITKEAISNKKDDIANSIAAKKDNAEIAAQKKQEFKQTQAEYKAIFRTTQKYGDIEIDDINKLFKIHNCTSNIKKSSTKAVKIAKGILAIGTYGASLAVEYALKPGDTIFSYDELIDYDLFENDLSVASGGLGRAIVGDVIAGAYGALIGGLTAKKKTKKSVDSMALQISTNNFFFPSIMITYITKETKSQKRKYTDAYSKAQESIACLNIIINQLKDKKENTTEDIAYVTNTNADPYEELKKVKELLEMGIISQEEFEAKKKELLGLL